jgi:hypothetical protein
VDEEMRKWREEKGYKRERIGGGDVHFDTEGNGVLNEKMEMRLRQAGVTLLYDGLVLACG